MLAAALLLAMLAGPATPPAEGKIALAKVKRLNKAHVRDEQCFDVCISWAVRSCKRVAPHRARCRARVVFALEGQPATGCRITNRWAQDGRRVAITSISKRCAPA